MARHANVQIHQSATPAQAHPALLPMTNDCRSDRFTGGEGGRTLVTLALVATFDLVVSSRRSIRAACSAYRTAATSTRAQRSHADRSPSHPACPDLQARSPTGLPRRGHAGFTSMGATDWRRPGQVRRDEGLGWTLPLTDARSRSIRSWRQREAGVSPPCGLGDEVLRTAGHPRHKGTQRPNPAGPETGPGPMSFGVPHNLNWLEAVGVSDQRRGNAR